MKLIVACFALLVVVVAAQDYSFLQGGFSSFQQPSGAFGNMGQGIQRDPRQDNGPVLFPQAPAPSGETSGVVVGASGYGFVPPSNQGFGRQFGVQNYY